LGRLGDAWVIASETCAFDLIDAQYVRDVEPGEMIVIDQDGLRSSRALPPQQHSMCLFEHVYFARPDSLVYGKSINESRHRMGRRLAYEHPADADIVVPVPDSGVAASIGYAAESGLSFRFGLVRNHYVGRTFIEPRQSIRSFGVRIKLNPVRDLINGKRVVLIDDSIVRGTTSKKIVRMVREAGAKEIHVRISCPPTISPCYYGVDTPNKSELIAANMSVDRSRLAGLPFAGGNDRGDGVESGFIVCGVLEREIPDAHHARSRDVLGTRTRVGGRGELICLVSLG
jgi:amidophosphoribosyltransferase